MYFDTATDSTRLMLVKRLQQGHRIKTDDGEFLGQQGATYARLGNLDKAIENINTGLEV